MISAFSMVNGKKKKELENIVLKIYIGRKTLKRINIKGALLVLH
jgi:hypothetical protein